MKSELFMGKASKLLQASLFVIVMLLPVAKTANAAVISHIENFALSGLGSVAVGDTAINENDLLLFNFYNDSLGDLTGVTIRLDSHYTVNLSAQAVSLTAGQVSIDAINDPKFGATLSLAATPLFSLDPAPLNAGCISLGFCQNIQTTGSIEFDELYTVLTPSLDDFKGIGQFSISVEELSNYSGLANGLDVSIFEANWAGSIAVSYEYTPTTISALISVPEAPTLSLFALGLGIFSIAVQRRRQTANRVMQKSPLTA